MTLLHPQPSAAAPVTPAADELAGRHWAANLRALSETQPDVVAIAQPVVPGVAWTFGRDGSLTALERPGHWWAGCSVPRAASAAMLASLDVRGPVGCFLLPAHAAALRVALDALKPEQAIVAVMTDPRALTVLLHTDDFSPDVAAHRLWFAAGDAWDAMLDRLLAERPGLPTPSQFIRVVDGTEEAADALIPPAQRVFADHAARRAARIAELRSSRAATNAASGVRRGCVVAPSRFRLWDDAGDVLARVAQQLDWPRFDPDDPASASPLALAEAVASCGAIVTANTSRAELPGVVADETPWVTWLTAPRVPSFASAGPGDALLVVNPAWRDLALDAGWPSGRVHVAGWPAADIESPAGRELVIIADAPSLEPPRQVVDFSSHRLLWEQIGNELLRDPFVLTGPVLPYLADRTRRAGLTEDAIDRRRFIDDLIAPAYARGIASALVDAGLPVRAHGSGWDRVPCLASRSRGPITTRDALLDALRGAAGVVHVWPGADAHPSGRYGRPLLRAARGRDALLRDGRRIVATPHLAMPATVPPMTPSLLASILADAGAD